MDKREMIRVDVVYIFFWVGGACNFVLYVKGIVFLIVVRLLIRYFNYFRKVDLDIFRNGVYNGK